MKFIHSNGSENFYLRKEMLGNQIIITVTDLKSLWRSELTEDEIVEIFKKQNPLAQADREKIMEYSHLCLDARDCQISVIVDEASKTLLLSLATHVSEFKVKLKFVLQITTNQEFFKSITNPLVAVLAQLMEQRSKLLDLVKSKDQELREYKLEGAEISRKNVETDEVMEKEFLDNTLTEFLEKTDKTQIPTRLNLSADLLEVFNKVSRWNSGIKSEIAPPPVVASQNGLSVSPVKKEIKRTLGNETIVQVPRSKQKRKHYL